jgi:hypothetical protein
MKHQREVNEVHRCTLCACVMRKLAYRQVRSCCHDGLLLASLRSGSVSQIEREAEWRCLADAVTAARCLPGYLHIYKVVFRMQ